MFSPSSRLRSQGGTAIQMGGVLPYRLEVYCSTFWTSCMGWGLLNIAAQLLFCPPSCGQESRVLSCIVRVKLTKLGEAFLLTVGDFLLTVNLPFETQLLQSVILFSELISITVTVTVIIFPGINCKTVMW